MNEKWLEDFWSDGNWGARQAIRDTEYEKRLAKKRNDEWQRQQEEYWRRQAQAMKEEFYAKFGEDNFHEGPCCGSCIGEMEDGYSGGGMYCCCNEGTYALENKDYKPKYPPINGELPPEFEYFGDRTKERYLKRFQKELNHEFNNINY